ncbi:YSC84-related protein [Ottowia sp.]|uniref:BPSL1445 family SYLF domain-containing lipoprotein n=1 Tax=Ottowia sp. TaxID=1898956 RepID=UPI002C67FF29|nr:YSC84-related protein [Ottowia sp.]HOB65461.1 YSC84-related protein [Ottowia sp.]HPZ57032.1 YSC84-related protein [Ottowia sp.]HQD47406.1 YSC84-related protein [Ottowia sp.]
MKNINRRTVALAVALGLGGATMVGCTTTTQGSQATPASSRAAMETAVNETLSRLYSTVPGSREMVNKAAGVLVFPNVVGGSFVVGADHGKGALRVGGRTVNYYSTTSASIGFQAGGQSRAVVYVFNTQDALQKFRNSNGWTADADATVAVGTVGANGHVDTKTVQQPIASFVLTNVGLEAGVAVGGSKISPINLP